MPIRPHWTTGRGREKRKELKEAMTRDRGREEHPQVVFFRPRRLASVAFDVAVPLREGRIFSWEGYCHGKVNRGRHESK
jgi:hypothetical protein